MEFGIFTGFNTREDLSQAETFDEWFRIADVAEEVGIDCFWLAEFHFRPRTILSSPVVVGSAIASRTKKMKVGMAVQLLPLANPLRLAEEVATLDHIAKGRLIYGVGRSSFIDAYNGYNVDYAESRPMFLEALDVIQRAWGDEPFSYEGNYYQYTNVDVMPKPFQRPQPEIRVACESRDTFGIMGKLGFPILMRHQMDVPELQSLIKQFGEERAAAGFSELFGITMQVPVYVAETHEQALADTLPYIMEERKFAREFARNTGDLEAYERLSRAHKVGVEELIQREGLGAYPNPFLFGTPEEVADRMQEYHETLGVTGFSMTINPGNIPYERMEKSLRLMGERVFPKLK